MTLAMTFNIDTLAVDSTVATKVVENDARQKIDKSALRNAIRYEYKIMYQVGTLRYATLRYDTIPN